MQIRGLALLLMLLGVGAGAQTGSVRDTYAIVGARVEVGDGRVIEKGTVVIRDGLIEAVGSGIVVPADAEIIQGAGLVVYPGFMDAHATKGLKLPDAKPDQDTSPKTDEDAPYAMREGNRKGVRPELHAADYLDLNFDAANAIRKGGFTTEMIAPTGNIVNGAGALLNLTGLPKRESVVRAVVGETFGFHASGNGYPDSKMGMMADIRQLFLDARRCRLLQTAFDNGSSRRPPADDVLASLLPVLDGKLPVIFETESAGDLRRALRLTDEFNLKMVISGGADAWKQADTLAKRKIPVLVSLDFGAEPGIKEDATSPPADKPKSPMPATSPDSKAALPPNTPKTPEQKAEADKIEKEEDTPPKAFVADRHRKWLEKVGNAQKLNQAGVVIAFTGKGVKDTTEFWKNLRRAIKEGLPKAVALRALTLDAATIFGVERQMGTVEAGKIAVLTVMTGDFADAGSKVKYLFIDRGKFEPESDKAPAPPAPAFPFGEQEKGE